MVYIDNKDGETAAEEFEHTAEMLAIYPVLPIKNDVIFPGTAVSLHVGEERSKTLLADLLGSRIVLVALKDLEKGVGDPDNVYNTGTLATVLRTIDHGDEIHIMVHGEYRVKLEGFTQERPYFKARITHQKDISEEGLEDLVIQVKDLGQRIIRKAGFPKEILHALESMDDPAMLSYVIAANLDLDKEQKQEILEIPSVKERLERLIPKMANELKKIQLKKEIDRKVNEEMSKTQKEYFLRQQIKVIKEELGDDDGENEIEEIRKKIKDAGMPDDVEKIALKEADRLSRMHPSSAEYTVSSSYLSWLLDMPWAVSTDDNEDIKRARDILDEQHYGLEKVKKRILEYLAVKKLKKDAGGPILCFVGPPGVGKTSVAHSVGDALGRKFVRISLGGVRDEAEIRGHRRTYIGALPGRIIHSLKKAGTNNPVIILDEIDKLGTDFRGDPSSALLEVLDPEQNSNFSDHYLEVPFDLSKVIFITTANRLDTIPGPLRDRMEIIDFPGYTREEKLMIAKNHLLPRQMDRHGLDPGNVPFEDEAILQLIDGYTREAGVRNLEREIASVLRGVAQKVAEGGKEKITVTMDSLEEYLGLEKFYADIKERTMDPGVATGLAWTPTGGEILFIESNIMPGKKGLTLTGQLGDVMKESAQAAMSYVKAHAGLLGIDETAFKNKEVHIHVPAGAIPKDGPSAGVALTTALVSLFRDKPLKNDIAMTGEITLKGKVLPVGGIKEKVLGARRAGINMIYLPKRNEKDLKDIPEEVRKTMKFKFVEKIDEVLDDAFLGEMRN